MHDSKKLIQTLYPSQAKNVFQELQELVEDIETVEPNYANALWYKNLNLYVVYPNQLKSGNKSAFESLIAHLPRIKELGCNAIHVLPFFDSPQLDKGFDIKNYRKVHPDYGTLFDVKRFKKAADEHGIRVFIDLVFNHVSDQHEWFQKAEAGDEKYRNYFIYTKEKPKYLRTFHKDAAVWAEYEIDGKKRAVNIAFPEHTGEIPHWRPGKDGYWYYHTYYPHQVDVDWRNPDVFLEYAQILTYWAELGFNFRLDAIPFVGKSAYKEVDGGNEKTFTIVAALKNIATSINRECVFIVETYETLETVIKYFGDTNQIQAELSYNFHLCTHLWVALSKEDSSFIWDTLTPMMQIPHRCEWLNFLRNHDELSLAYLNDELKEAVSQELLERGATFREGYGISGRTYSLLGHDEKRFFMSYFLLMSLGGGIAIPYGDEIGMKNVPLSSLSEQDQKDTRNINRGTIFENDFEEPKAKRIFSKLKYLLEQRNTILNQYINVDIKPVQLKTKKIFAAKYEIGTSELLILINLSATQQNVKMNLEGFVEIAQVNGGNFDNEAAHLGPYAGLWLQR